MTRPVSASVLRRISPVAPSRYHGRLAALATKHAKERAFSWPLSRGLGLSLCVSPGIDTDMLGTFTGEFPREGTPAEVVRRKARAGMDATKLPVGIASEGSFGPHPMVQVVPSDFEVLVFVDDEQSFTVSQEIVTTETNDAQQRCANLDEAFDFAARVHFPSHHLVARPAGNPDRIHKGVNDREALRVAVLRAIDASPERATSIETDMRAHAKPTSMRVIRHLSARLARRLRTFCPECDCPGFGKTGAEHGLACEDCGASTELVFREIHGCPRCKAQRSPRADRLTAAPARHCPVYNP